MRLKIYSSFSILLLLLSSLAFSQNASFTAAPTTGCAPLVVSFNNTSTGTGLTYFWDFGNGVTSVLQHPSTVYLTAGSYTVKLRVKDASGNMDSVTYTNLVVASQPPTVSFWSPDTVSLVCGVKTATFHNTSTLNAPGAGSYQWDFGTGSTLTTATAAPLTHTYAACGNYSVTLVATNSVGCAASVTKTAYIKVPCKPAAAFTAANTNGCGIPYTVNFNAAATTGAVSYTWNFGDGSAPFTGSAATASHTYTAAGSYDVTLIATSANGCKDTLVKPAYVVIHNTQAQFTPSATVVCAGAPVSFTNASTPAGGSSTWFFKWPSNASADKSSAANPTYTYTAPGTYTVKLVYLANGCRDTATTTITVNPKPAIAFTGSPLTACNPPLNVNFTNTTSGATTYTWLFGDGGTSTLANPSHAYTANGNYAVSLIATSAAGCKDTLKKNNYVKIAPASAVINGPQELGCAPATATFTLSVTSVTGTSGYSYTWNWGDGTPNTTTTSTSATHTYSTFGNYTITVTGTGPGGCTFTSTKAVVVGKKPSASFTAAPTTVCLGTSVFYTNTSTDATSYTWYFGDAVTSTATNPSHSFTDPGLLTTMLVANNGGCMDTAYATITVVEPKANFSAFLPNCNDRLTVCFNNTSISSGPTLYEWDFGVAGMLTDTSTAKNPCYTFPAYGNYSVKLKVTNLTTGCTHTKTATVKVFALEAQLASADTSVCIGQTANFQAQTAPNYNQYSWNWGDGSPWQVGSSASASHAYAAPGAYTVKLVVRDIYSCRDTLTLTNLVKVKGVTPGIVATPTVGCKPVTVHFTDTATPIFTTITDRIWYFGEAPDPGLHTGTVNTATHTYSTGYSTFDVKLVYVMAGGCTDSITMPDMITTYGPVADFAINPDTNFCAGAPVTIVNNSSGFPTTYLWLFPDGTTSTSETPPPYITSGSGLQQIKLIVGIPGVCNDTLSKNIMVHQVTAHFTMSDSVANCPPLMVDFANNTTVTPASALTFNWDFGNGASSTAATPSTIYNTAGTFTPKLVVTSALGCQDSIIKNVHVDTGATATLEYATVSGCVPQAACFHITNIINSTSIVLDFQDGTTYEAATSGADTTVCHDFNQGGAYVPVLVMSNTGTGCYSIIQNPDTIVLGEPQAGFMAATYPVCQYVSISFADTSSSNGVDIIAWDWDFGDPGSGAANTSTLQNPTHTFLGAGTRTIRLIVTDATGCSDTAFSTVTVNPAPVVNAGPDVSICTGSSTTLNATGATTYAWGPASSGLSCYNCPSPVASPAATTTYWVTGTNSANGCTATDTIQVTIAPLPPAPTVISPVTYCQNDVAAPLTATVSAPGNTLNWYTVPTGGTPLGAAPTPVTTAPGTFIWYVSQSTPGGGSQCEGPRVSITVVVNPAPAAPTAPAPVNYCQGAAAAPLTATALPGHTLLWYTEPAGGAGSTAAPTPATATAGTFTYYVSQKNNTTHCESPRVAVSVIINPLPPAPTASGVTYCQNATALPLTATAAPGNTLKWYTVPAGGSPLPGAPTPATATVGTSTWYVSQINPATGCEGPRTPVVVTITTTPTVSAGANQYICLGSTATLIATGASTYSWTPAAGLSSTAGATLTASPAATTTYTVIGALGGGCADTAQVTVTVLPVPDLSVTPAAATICEGSTATLTATGASTYTWSPAAGLSTTTSAVVTATPATTTTYQVVGAITTSGISCYDTATAQITVNPKPAITVSGITAICSGGNTTLTASGGYSYTWSPAVGLSATTGAVVTANPVTTTTYTVTGVDELGCSNTTTVTITVSPLPAVTPSASATAVCPGSTVTLSTPAVAGVTYSWSPAIACTGSCHTGTATVYASATYTVTATNAAGCTASSSVAVTAWTPPTVAATNSTTAICPGDSTQLTATGATTYLWTAPTTGLSSTTIANPKAAPLTTTTYTVIGTDAHGCKDTATVNVAVHTPPTVTASPNTSICMGGSTNLSAAGAASYVWSPATGLSSATIANPVASPATTTTYTVIGTGANGCKDTATTTVTVNALPTISAGTDTSVCLGLGVQLQATPTAGLTFAWSPAAGLSSTSAANPIAAPATTTSYVVTGTDAFGCSGKDTVVVTVWTPPAVSAATSVAAICPGDTAQLTATGALTYTWMTPVTGLTCTTCPDPKAAPMATTTYTVIGKDVHGCKDTATVPLLVHTPPTVSAGGSYDVCLGSSVTLNATGAASYVWSPAAGLSATNIPNPVATPADTTVYTVIGTNANGCKDTATATVFTHPLPVINAGPDTSVCPGFGVQLHATPSTGFTFAWTLAPGLSAVNIPDPVASPTSATTYTVTATDAFGCSGSDQVTVTMLPVPVVNVSATQDSVCQWGSVTLEATGALNYLWQPGNVLSSTLTVNPATTTTYTVIGTNASGCKDTAALEIGVYPELNITTSPDVVICEGAATELSASGAVSYVWSPAATLSSPTGSTTLAMPDSNTVYTVIATDANGCTDTAAIRVSVILMQPVAVGPGGSVCKGGEVRLSASGGTSYSWFPATGLSNPNSANPVARPEETTTYTVTITQGSCFVETREVTVEVYPSATIELGNDRTLHAGSTLQLTPAYQHVDQFLWTPSDGLSCTDCPAPVAAPTQTTTYTVYATNSYGCNDTDKVTINVLCDGSEIWLPNTFTPNGDGNNDRFYARGKGVTHVESFRIYNRWGEVVYEAQNVPVDDINYSWDGTYKGKMLSPDVFMYVIKASCGKGEAVQIKGDITLIR